MPNTINIHRVLKAPVSRVFRAFSDPAAKATWLPPFGFICNVQSFDFKVGGQYRMSFTNFTNGQTHSWGGSFKEIKQDQHLVITDKFDDPNMPGEMTVTVSFKEVMCGTELTVKQEGIPDMIPTEMCYLGWQESLVKLAQLVEPEINQ
jgi:uncharacterized protein YndB with AHSA1/START domain